MTNQEPQTSPEINEISPELTARVRFARNMRIYRLMMRCSQENLADRCGLDRTYIGSVERGERNISIDNMERIAKVLNQKLSKLVDEDTFSDQEAVPPPLINHGNLPSLKKQQQSWNSKHFRRIQTQHGIAQATAISANTWLYVICSG